MTPTPMTAPGRRELAIQEGVVLRTYADPTGTLTCCCGHTAAAGDPKPVAGQVYSAAQCDAILTVDLAKIYEPAVARHVDVSLAPCENDALVILTYNIGEPTFAKSTLLKRLNAGDKSGAASHFGDFVRSHGQVLPGLVKRREVERRIFLGQGYPGVSLAPADTMNVVKASVTLGPGMTGNAVRSLQASLKTLGYLADAPDGDYGPKTRAAVIEFQKAESLAADGIAGLKTGMALTNALAATAKPSIPLVAPVSAPASVLPSERPKGWLERFAEGLRSFETRM